MTLIEHECSKHGTLMEQKCVECMRIWARFVEENNLYVVTDD